MDTEKRIRERAHEIWEAEGRPHGRHEEHWRLAREQVAGEKELEKMGGPLPEAAKRPARRTRAAKPKAAPAEAPASDAPPPVRPRRTRTSSAR